MRNRHIVDGQKDRQTQTKKKKDSETNMQPTESESDGQADVLKYRKTVRNLSPNRFRRRDAENVVRGNHMVTFERVWEPI